MYDTDGAAPATAALTPTYQGLPKSSLSILVSYSILSVIALYHRCTHAYIYTKIHTEYYVKIIER